MDAALLSALAALAGSVIGGATSFFTTWLGQGAQLRAQLVLYDKGRRQDLYREFVDEASSLYIDGLTRETPDLSRAVRLYALISRMRILSSHDVIDQADKVARLIFDSYALPDKTYAELREMVKQGQLDPLRGFSEAAREELHQLAPVPVARNQPRWRAPS